MRLLKAGVASGVVLELNIKAENLELHKGTAVVIQGLEKARQWNGQRGLIQDFDKDTRRYAVKVQGRDRALALKMGCCMPEAFVDTWEPEVCDPKLSAWRNSSAEFSACRCRSKSRDTLSALLSISTRNCRGTLDCCHVLCRGGGEQRWMGAIEGTAACQIDSVSNAASVRLYTTRRRAARAMSFAATAASLAQASAAAESAAIANTSVSVTHCLFFGLASNLAQQ